MRSIAKGAAPAPLTAWLTTYGHTTVSWDDFGRHHAAVKHEVKRGLVAEQGAICCYCEREIGCAGARPDAHIEHLQPKSAHPHLTYAWTNLLASCEDEKHRGNAPESCGHQKRNHAIAVTPLQPGCAARFLFDDVGHVSPAPGLSTAEEDDVRATIATLGLDTERPRILRKAAIAAILDLVLAEADAAAAAQVELTRLSVPDANGRWTPFVTAITQALQRLL